MQADARPPRRCSSASALAPSRRGVRPPADRLRRRRRRARRLRPPGRRPVDDEHRHRRPGRDRDPGRPAGPRRLAARPRHRQHRRGRGGRPGDDAQARATWASTCRSSATSTTTATSCSSSTRRWPRLLAKYRINPGNVGAKRHDEHFATIVRVAIENDKPVRIGVNWGSLDQQLLTELMDANARSAEPRDARDVMIEAMIESAMRSAELAEADRPAARPDHPVGQGVGRARPRRRLPPARRALATTRSTSA